MWGARVSLGVGFLATAVSLTIGVSYGALGTTHHSLHDLAALRAIHNIDIVAPADNFETREVIKLAAKRGKPIYIRFGKAALYDLKSGISDCNARNKD